MSTNLEQLYDKAKEAYYNGQPIMDDYAFDELEAELGLENKSYVGAKHNPSYTIEHPFVMGSLSKVQIKENDKGIVDFGLYFNEIAKYLNYYEKFKSDKYAIIATPKYDGCSFEVVVHNYGINSISSRGDGNFGKNLYHHLYHKIISTVERLNEHMSCYVIRGEVLIDKYVFEQKYSDFVNPRSFVSGILNRDYCEDEDFKAMLSDLSLVVYDIRNKLNEYENGYIDYDFTKFEYPTKPTYYKVLEFDSSMMEELYTSFSNYRQTCEFALDGFVLKPRFAFRHQNLTDVRPKDCVAVKFIPMLEETTVVDIEWNMSKTNEMTPVVIVKPVIMDGKKVTRASAHNYGYIKDNRISKGTKLILSLAGDIIPFIYKITDTTSFSIDKINLPNPEFEGQYTVSGCHLYKILSDEERREMKFIQSANSLNIPNIGPAAAKTIYDYLVEQSKPDDFLGIDGKEVPNNILCCYGSDISNALGGKSGANAMKAFDDFKKQITLSDVIVSCTFDSCGKKIAEAIQDYLLLEKDNFEHLASKAYMWCKDPQSNEMNELNSVLEKCGKTLDIFKQELQYINETKREQIPVILTGEPNNYVTKDAFLREHPEYRLTTSWKEVQIVFTNSLESNTGKMKKAKEKGIKLLLY